jgi:hypothetical protein
LLKFRHGIAPVSKNVVNIRYKKKPNFDKEMVRKVEDILKDLIDFGFSDHVVERLLEFDEDGNLRKVIEGNSGSDRRDIGQPVTQVKSLKSFMRQGNEEDILMDDDDGSVATSNLDDVMSSIKGDYTGNVSSKNKSVMKSDIADVTRHLPKGDDSYF